MAFDREAPNTPAAIEEIRITFQDPTGVPADMGASFFIRVLNQNGELYREITGDLGPHLTSLQRGRLRDFMLDLRAQAVAEILPTP